MANSMESASKQKGPAVQFSIWAVALMTAAAVVSLRGLPMMAKEGLTMWFYIGFATLFFSSREPLSPPSSGACSIPTRAASIPG